MISASPKGFVERPACPLCASEKKRSLIRLPYSHPVLKNFLDNLHKHRLPEAFVLNEVYDVVQCLDCGFVWQLFIPNEDQMAVLYEHIVSAEESLEKKKSAPFSLFSGYASEMEVIYSLFKQNPCQVKVLDFGMGWGFWAVMARAFGFRTAGHEVSLSRMEYARQKGIDLIAWEAIPDSGFDFINADQVFEHIPRPLETLRHLVRGLRPKGVIRLSVPNGRKIGRPLTPETLLPVFPLIYPLEHINCFNPLSLENLGKHAGLKPLGAIGPGLKSILTKAGRTIFPGSRLFKRSTTQYFLKVF
jgi:2-polyprenyl-3-methyl-5-hydroxy-6-metoxy-1,4-benzoquinol methylase